MEILKWTDLLKEAIEKPGVISQAYSFFHDYSFGNQMLALQRRLRDPGISLRSARALTMRGAFTDALAWLEVHGEAPEIVERWRGLIAEMTESGTLQAPPTRVPPRRRRRRPRRPIVQ